MTGYLSQWWPIWKPIGHLTIVIAVLGVVGGGNWIIGFFSGIWIPFGDPTPGHSHMMMTNPPF